MWSGSISFGLVNVPVKLYAAVSPKEVHFHQVHDADGVRIQQKRICPADNKEVPYEHIVKGYEVAPDQYVIVKPSELEALDPEASRTIDIQSFTDLSAIDPLFYEHSYYLAPDKGAGKAYALLLKAMQESKKVAVAKAVIRSKGFLTALRPIGDALTMSTLYYADEVLKPESIEELKSSHEMKLDERELAMAKKLIDSLSERFKPEKYHDEYRERVLDLIKKKSEGEEIVTQPAHEAKPKVINLMEALEASLATARKDARRTGTATAERSKPAGAHGAGAHRHAARRKKTA
jgi:DNA end-binding protein Ku